MSARRLRRGVNDPVLRGRGSGEREDARVLRSEQGRREGDGHDEDDPEQDRDRRRSSRSGREVTVAQTFLLAIVTLERRGGSM